MDKKIIWIFGIVLPIIMLLFWIISFKVCTDNIGCIVYLAIPLLPSVLLKLKGTTSIIVSRLFWFLLGSLIGFLVYKVKKTKR